MKVTVKFYAAAREHAGTPALDIVIDEPGPTVGDVLQRVVQVLGPAVEGTVLVHPGPGHATTWVPRNGYMLMVHDEIAGDPAGAVSIVVRDGDVVGILPPFSGG